MGLERIATDTYDFERVRSMGFTYIDKTDKLYSLVDGSIGFQFFLSRPRRFGKSLLISTTQKLFEGRRDLFEGLAIDGLPWDWSVKYPVVRLDMSMCSGATVEEVQDAVAVTLRRESERLGVPLRKGVELREQFALFVDDVAATGPLGQLVLLIDEYDKPLTRWVGTPEVLPFQAFLKSFYSVVKLTESKQRFCLMPGVSKISKVSIFSDLNNLTDITMDMRFSSLLGYTHDEVRANFPGRLAALAQVLGTDVDGAFARLVSMYDGYCFDRSMTRVFNPVSLGRCLDSADMRAYWFETGTPGWLMSYAKREPIDVDFSRWAMPTWALSCRPTPPCQRCSSKQATSPSKRFGARTWAQSMTRVSLTGRFLRASTAGLPTLTCALVQTFLRRVAGQWRASARCAEVTRTVSWRRSSPSSLPLATTSPIACLSRPTSVWPLPSCVLSASTWMLR